MKVKIDAVTTLFIIQSTFWLISNIISPFMAIFLINEYGNVGLTEYGISNLIFYLAFGLLLPIVGKFEDKKKGLFDEYTLLNLGLITRGILFILLSLMSGVWALYMIQMLMGFSRALFSPSYKTLLISLSKTRKNTSYLFSVDESLTNIFSAIGSGLSGYLATVYGGRVIIFAVGVMFVTSVLFSLPLKRYLSKK